MRTPVRVMLWSLSIALLSAVAYAWQLAGNVKLPPPFATPSSRNNPRVVERPAGADLKLPAGFHVDEFATGLQHPRIMLYGPSGELLVTESVKNGRVSIIFDRNNDFKVDDKKALIEGLDRPYGMAFWKDYLYVAEPT